MMIKPEQRIKVLYVVSRLRQHGPISQLYNIVNYLDKEIFTPIILTLSPEANDSRLADFLDIGVEYYSFDLSRIRSLWEGVDKLSKFLSLHPVDIMHASDFRSSTVITKTSSVIPKIITRREAFYKAKILDNGYILGIINEIFHSSACRRADRVVAVSKYVREAAGRIKGKVKIDVILNGIETSKFKPVTKEKCRELKNKLDLPCDKIIFVTAGWFNKRKDPLTMVRGFINSNIADKSLFLFLGDGSLRGSCEKVAKGHSNVRFIGFVDNVVEYIQASKYFVLSSLFEGCPNAAMEGLACGIPVILSDIGPHCEIMELNSKAGHLFAAGDPNSLAKQMEKIIVSDYRQLRQAALSITDRHLNAKKMSSQYQELYKEMIKNKTI